MTMKKPALCDEILMKIQSPVRYIGNELNSVDKSRQLAEGRIAIRSVMCFPDVYEIGMSHLGIQILYDMFNKREDVWCERVYSPWPDLHQIMKEENIPLFALESQEPVKDFDFLGITLQYEMAYTNILQILDLAQIPLLAKDRGENDPLVHGGGPCSYNPEPIADFFDFFYMGEGEVSYDRVFDLYKEMKARGCTRAEFLRQASKIEGIYVPSLYEVSYKEDGTIAAFTPKYEDVPATVKKVIVEDFNHVTYPEKPIVPFLQATQDRMVLEIQRGCIRGCRFCQAGMIYRPNREKDVEHLKEIARSMVHSTGYDEISLSSLSSSDYHQLGELTEFLVNECKSQNINISLPSLRIDAFSLDIMSKVQDIKKSSLTFAPEAGTQRMRNVINKGLTVDNILNGSEQAFLGGWNKVKLYFMLGLPTETKEDQQGIAELANEIAALYYDTVPKEKRQGKCQITISTSFFVPKPFTPFQWARMYTPADYLSRAKVVNDAVKASLNHKSIRYNWHQADVTVIEGILARGDRRIAPVLMEIYRQGGFFDAWSEYFDNDRWMKAFESCGLDPDFYTLRERSDDEIFPWDFIDVGVSKKWMLKEWHKAIDDQVITPNCRQQCAGCGAMRFGGGVCYENKN